MAIEHFIDDALPNGIYTGTRINPNTKDLDVVMGGYSIPSASFLAFAAKVQDEVDGMPSSKRKKKEA